ncbi:MAG: hypothetical protein V3S49_01065 [Thermodesulfobacteriota bacterium]
MTKNLYHLSPVVILPMLRDSESLLKKDSGFIRLRRTRARMTNGKTSMTDMND